MPRQTKPERRKPRKQSNGRRSGDVRYYASPRARWIKFFKITGTTLAIVVFVVWVAAWIILSGFGQNVADRTGEAVLSTTVKKGYQVKNVLVEGRVHIAPDFILSATNVQRGDPIFSFDPVAAQAALAENGWVKNVRVTRKLPDTVSIIIEERVPYALYQEDGKMHLIDQEGVFLPDEGLPLYTDLPAVTGEGAPQHAAEIIPLIAAEPLVAAQNEYAIRRGGRRWDLLLKNDIRVLLPENDPAFALRRLSDAIERDDILSKAIEEIDLRQPDRIIVETDTSVINPDRE